MLCDADTPTPDVDVDLVALDEALAQLELLDARQCRVVELRFFGGLSVEETAAILGVSPRTVELDWKMARAWLYQRLAAR
jgi:RNA polymerase sigma-70 factor, ECF subfamily